MATAGHHHGAGFGDVLTTAILIVNAKPIFVLALNVLNVCSGSHAFVECKRVSASVQVCADLQGGGKHGGFFVVS